MRENKMKKVKSKTERDKNMFSPLEKKLFFSQWLVMEHANGLFVKALYITTNERSIKDANEVKLLQIDRFMVSPISQNGKFFFGRCNNKHTFQPYFKVENKSMLPHPVYTHVFFNAVHFESNYISSGNQHKIFKNELHCRNCQWQLFLTNKYKLIKIKKKETFLNYKYKNGIHWYYA